MTRGGSRVKLSFSDKVRERERGREGEIVFFKLGLILMLWRRGVRIKRYIRVGSIIENL